MVVTINITVFCILSFFRNILPASSRSEVNFSDIILPEYYSHNNLPCFHGSCSRVGPTVKRL
jgi:hypothetical protein